AGWGGGGGGSAGEPAHDERVASDLALLAEADATFDLGLLDLDAKEPIRKGSAATLELVRSKTYGFECRCRRSAADAPSPKILGLYIEERLKRSQKMGTIATVMLHKIPEESDDQVVTYRGVLKPLYRGSTGRLRVGGRQNWLLEQGVAIRQ
ncbi:MAG: hypothetical protein WD872_00640, partial [Pirellulaceae bacterium]